MTVKPGFLLAIMLAGGSAAGAWADTVNGRFTSITMDGAMADWQPGDVFYDDSQIGDGAPLNSSYSNLYVANDATHLYIGAQLKEPSSIFSNWTHTLYIDSDHNAGTGFNAGWMSHGYDRLIQYGAGGGVYSVYAFTGGGSQGSWSWDFLTTFAYAYDGAAFEWALPLAQLGISGNNVDLEFNVSGGSVTIDTWANASEASARTYALAATPSYTLQVVNARGTAVPAAGAHVYSHGAVITNTVTEPAAANGTQYVSLGWTLSNHAPASGSTTSFTATVTNSATLTWLWQTNVQFTRTAGANGSVSGDASGYYVRNGSVTVTATAANGHLFGGWSGDVPAGQTNDNPLVLSLDRARSVTAHFRLFTGRFAGIALDGNMAEWQAGDRFYQDFEILDGAPLNSTYSNIYVANDATYLYVGLQLKEASSILSNWLHALYIDTDVNAGTGYNAGWMGNGYDRLVQYGGGGGSYSIFTFSGGSQSSWSWNFTDEIAYAFNGDVIEWAIPRSALGGSTQAKLEFYVGGGSVSIETWAEQTELNARLYAFAATPSYTLQVVNARGTSVPAAGSHVYSHGTVITNTVTEPAAASGTQYVSLGWTLSNHAPASGSTTSFTATVTNSATLTWLWQTNVQFTRTAGANGSISGDASGYYLRNGAVTVTATAANGYLFGGWSGAVPTGQTNDNPLVLTLDRARSITAGFRADYGRFATPSMDGSLADWQPGDAFYEDGEIVDGAPLNSTYSDVYVANDQAYLYVGLQLKAASSIFSNWTHELYLDTDTNPATGFNAGWMTGGYDMLVQYGVGGTVYSVYSFSGGSQAAWSWDFLGTIGYAFNGDVIEWAIPRSLLGATTMARLQFHVGNGDVTTETWGHHTEASARNYAFASTPSYTLQVVNARGTAVPAAGSHVYSHGTVITNTVTEPAAASGTQYVSLGWTLSNHAPASGSTTSFTATVTNSATLTWLWQTNVQFTRTAGANGSITGDTSGYYALLTGLSVSAVPDSGFVFAGWSGDVPAGQTNDNPLNITMDRRRSITANFTSFLGRYATLAVDANLADWVATDAFYTDAEISDGLPLNSTYSNVFVANDLTYLFVGLQLKAPASISSNWTHNLYIDSDLNPNTGFDAGWMGNGYDRLVQYGANGGVYSVYAFSGGSQAAWSWDFLGVISYAFSEERIEWALPRALLGMTGSACKLEFQVTDGAVSVETWAHHTESSAYAYTMASPPAQTLQIIAAHGTAVPAAGIYTNAHGAALTNRVTAPVAANGTQYVALGWTVSGNDPLTGATTNFTMTHTNTAVLTWLWQTNVLFARSAGAGGTVSGPAGGYYPYQSSITITATPQASYLFAGWTGDVPSGHENDAVLDLTMDRTRSLTATFAQDVGRHAAITLDGAMGEWQAGDVFYDDSEILDGLPLNSTYSNVLVANDTDYLYVGLQLKDSSSILSNWTHELYIDSDNNPATGFNAGWMSGGYDRLVQYGVGGTVYSVYAFTGNTSSEWSWNFLGTIGYAYNNEIIEWAIPRSSLGTGSIMRLEFHVLNGSVTAETWAHAGEVSAKSYAFATPNNCPSDLPPVLGSLPNRTVTAGSLLSFQLTATDPACVAPSLTATGMPAGASFSATPSGNTQVGTFTWTPGPGDAGTHVIRFIATDDQDLATSAQMRIYVAQSGEQTNAAGVPVSQTNWHVTITNIAIPASGNVTVVWDAVEGITYDVYQSDNNLGGSMTWTKVVTATEADSDFEQAGLSASVSQRYFQVVPAGGSPISNGVWAVIRPTVNASTFTLVSPGTAGDRAFDGALGSNLAQVLSGDNGGVGDNVGDEVFILEANQSWRNLYLDASGVWRESGGGVSTFELAEGQGFQVLRNSGSAAQPRFTGPAGNVGTSTNVITDNSGNGGWNIITFSQGRHLSVAEAFLNLAEGSPEGNWDETQADLILILNSNGSWRRIMRTGSGTWLDLATFTTPTHLFGPGAAVFYYRQPVGTMRVRF